MRTSTPPFAALELFRTPSVAEAQARGGSLLGRHRIRARGRHFDARIHGASFGCLSIYYMSYGAPLTIVGEVARDTVGVTVPIRGSMLVEHAGASFLIKAGRSAAIFSADYPLRLDWSADLEFLCFVIEERALRGLLFDVEQGVDPSLPVRFLPRMTDGAGLSGLLSSARLLERVASRDTVGAGRLPSSTIAGRIADQVMTTLLLTQPRPVQRTGRHGNSLPVSRLAARRARKLAEDSPTPVTPSELASRVGVSLRTLQAGFQSEWGVSPQPFLLQLRLRRAHADLLSAASQDGATVSAVAARWGFSNLGRFAEHYRRAYGVRPGDTLRGIRATR